MPFRWRGGTKGYLSRRIGRAVSRELTSGQDNSKVLGCCLLVVLLIVGACLCNYVLSTLVEVEDALNATLTSARPSVSSVQPAPSTDDLSPIVVSVIGRVPGPSATPRPRRLLPAPATR
jgi:hypothetical protein